MHLFVMQVAAFRAGFEEVFPLHSLNAFYEDEIEAMLCGTGAALIPDTAASTMTGAMNMFSPPVPAWHEP
jgi:HECT-domain (ubiquitin-transferase)